MLSTTGAGEVFAGSSGAFTVSASPAAAIIQKIERDRASYSISRDAESRLRHELEESKLALFRRSHETEESNQQELEALRMHYDATIHEKDAQWKKRLDGLETGYKLKMVKLMEETYEQIQSLQTRSAEEKEALMQVSQDRLAAEEAATAEGERKLRKAEKQFASVIKVNSERENEFRTSIEEIRREMAAAQALFEEKEAAYKDETEKRDVQMAAVEEMGKEREKWRETVFDSRVRDALKPCLEQQAGLEGQVAELRSERDALKQAEEADALKIDALRVELSGLMADKQQVERALGEVSSRLSVEEALRSEGAKALRKSEESLLAHEAMHADRLAEWSAARDELQHSLAALQSQHDAAEVHYQEEIDKRDQQIVGIEAMGKEREQWRETVFDRRIEETLRPYKDRQSVLESLVQELTAEKDAWKAAEDTYKAKISTIQSDLDVHVERESSLARTLASLQTSLEDTKTELASTQATLRQRLNDLQANVEATRQQEVFFASKEREWGDEIRSLKNALEGMREEREELRLDLSGVKQQLVHVETHFAIRDALATDLQARLNDLSDQSRTAVDDLLRKHMASESAAKLQIEELTHRAKETESTAKSAVETAHRELTHAAEMADSRERALNNELQLATAALTQAKMSQQHLELTLGKTQRNLEQMQLTFQAEEVLCNEKILDAVHEVNRMKEVQQSLSHWKQTSYALAMACVQTCAGALTIPDFQISADGMAKMSQFVRNRADMMHALTRPQDVVEFLRMNSLRGNVLVNRDLLGHVLQQSKTVIERFKNTIIS